jgi:hypothetical protein
MSADFLFCRNLESLSVHVVGRQVMETVESEGLVKLPVCDGAQA